MVEEPDTTVSIRELYVAARRSAFDVDGLVRDMLTDMQKGKVTTPEKEPGPEDIPF